jgi:molybdopterin-containing oxidoreductase family membrane subunit
MYDEKVRGELIEGNKTLGDITNDILRPIESAAPKWWFVAMTLSSAAVLWGVYSIYITITYGIGMWNLNNSVGWGWDIINFVWWIGIGHAGTAFSIFLLILRQKWRTSINRAAEAMTVFAVICAGLFPVVHMGRVWDAFFVFPYPNTRGSLWVNFNSPLFWDFTAISTYLTISASFWYLGMLPDFGTIRDRTTSKLRKAIYGFFAMGWTGSSRNWQRYEAIAFVLGGMAAMLVVSVHSIVSTDFASSVEPGWHTTIFPPYFVVGAIFSGFAMVMTLMIIIRKFYNLHEYVTDSHLNATARILTFVSLIMGTSYMTEIFIAWYSGNKFELFTFFHNRITGDYAPQFWAMFTCNAIIPQLFWFKKVRSSLAMLFIISIIINIGMWFERYNIIVTSLAKDYLPSSWVTYSPSIVEVGVFVGTLGIFSTGVLLFFRYIPMMAIHELKTVINVGEKSKNYKTENN